MVEIIYNEENADRMKTENLIRLPRNIRQIGTVNDKNKVYTEDYVKSYLDQYYEKNLRNGFILFGKTITTQDKEYLFIDGAVSVRPDQIFHENIEVNAEAWEKLRIAAKEFFPDLEMVGWACGDDLREGEKIRRQFFPEDGRVFLRLGETEPEYYITNSFGLHIVEGYYIYYARNEAMQTYMIEQQEEQQDRNETVAEPVVEQFRQIMKERKEIVKHGRMMTVLSCASSFLALVVLAIGITMINNYEKMQAMEVALVELTSSLDENQIQQRAEAAPVNDDSGSNKPETAQVKDQQDLYIEETELPMKQEQEVRETVQPEEPVVEAFTQESAKALDRENLYIVKKGDTLAGISMQFYQTRDMVDPICEKNHIDNCDMILCGQKILLP